MTGLGFGEASHLAFPAFPSAPPPLLLRSPLRSSPPPAVDRYDILRQGEQTFEYLWLERVQDVVIWRF